MKDLTRECCVIPPVYVTQFDDLLIVKDNLHIYTCIRLFTGL